jgi:hypothetical protein
VPHPPTWTAGGGTVYAAQSSGPPAPMPASGPPAPMSGPPMSGQPMSGQPMSGPPAHVSGPPQAWNSGWTDPAPPPAAEGAPPAWQPRIVPSPPPQRGKLILGLVIGLVAGMLIAAPATYFLAPSRDDGAKPRTDPSPSASRAALQAFEQNQANLNKAKFSGDLVPMAQPWLPYMSSCLLNTDDGGPRLGTDESTHVMCRYGGVFVHFVTFKGPLERDRSRAFRQRLNGESKALAAGMEEPSRKPRTSDKTVGTYLEYALKNSEQRVLTGIWWDPEGDKPIAMYVEARWEEVLGGSWDPLRDLWQTRS